MTNADISDMNKCVSLRYIPESGIYGSYIKSTFNLCVCLSVQVCGHWPIGRADVVVGCLLTAHHLILLRQGPC